eukprot:4721261-Amphidinium_carterae.1
MQLREIAAHDKSLPRCSHKTAWYRHPCCQAASPDPCVLATRHKIQEKQGRMRGIVNALALV